MKNILSKLKANCCLIIIVAITVVLTLSLAFLFIKIQEIELNELSNLFKEIWLHGTWLGISAFSLLMLLAWFVMGADFKFRNKTEIFTVMVFALLSIFPTVWSLDIQPMQAKTALKSLLPDYDRPNQNTELLPASSITTPNNKPVTSKTEFNLLSVVIPIVAMFLSLFPFLIAKTFREHTAELRAEIKSAGSIKIVALNSKCYSYFNRKLNDISQYRQTSEYERIVEFFVIYYEDNEELLIQLKIIAEGNDFKILRNLTESKHYINALKEHYTDKAKEANNEYYQDIVEECKKLLKKL